MHHSRRFAPLALAAVTLLALLPSGARAGTVGPVAPPAPAPVVAPAEPGVEFDHHAFYEFDPAAKVVHVRHEATIKNTKPDVYSGYYVQKSYLPRLGVPVVAQAVGFGATKAGSSALPVSLEPTESPFVSVAMVDLQPDVFSGQSQSITLTYDLPAVAPRTKSFVRVNDAFVSFPVFLDGDPGRTSVEVRVPSSFEIEVVGSEMDREREGGTTILRAEPSDPRAFFASIVARNDKALVSKSVDAGEHSVVVQAWPGDTQWAKFATAQARDGIPALEKAIGLDWPASRDLDLVETAAPYLYGYAGWYQPFESLIEVGDELDAQVMLHELAHVWFNNKLFTDRWISEGLADVFAAHVAAEGGKVDHPDPIDRSAPGAVLLNDWSTPDIQDGGADQREAFGYNASWAVIDAIASEVGLDGLAEVVRLADAGTYAYDGPGLDDRKSRRADWRQLLDLLEERAGSKKAAELFTQHVVSEADTLLFEARTSSRSLYAGLLERGDGWLPPAVVRLAMSEWRFDAADRLIARTSKLLKRRDAVEEQLAGLDATTAGLQADYEATRNLEALEETVGEAADAAADLHAADRAADRSVGPLGAIGLLFRSPSERVDRAEAAFTAGDFAAADTHALVTIAMVDDATRDGVVRLVAILLVALIAVGLRRLWGRHKAHRAERAAAALADREAAEQEAAEREAPGSPGYELDEVPVAAVPEGVRDPER